MLKENSLSSDCVGKLSQIAFAKNLIQRADEITIEQIFENRKEL